MPQDIVRVLQITDPHLFAEADNNLRGTVTADTLNAVVDHVLEQRWPADFVVLTGDLDSMEEGLVLRPCSHGKAKILHNSAAKKVPVPKLF